MTDDRERYAEHSIEIDAPAGFLYGLVAAATAGPLVFPGTVHVEYLTHTSTEERLRIWAVNGEHARTWTSHRTIDAAGRTVTFGQEEPAPPVAAMTGQWQVEPLAEHRSRVTLRHTYRAVDGDPDGEKWIAELVETVSAGQLAAMREFAALGAPDDRATLLFADSVELGYPVERAYEFVADPDRWADAGVPVEQVKVRQADAGIQLVDVLSDGQECTAARVPFPNSRIAFKVLRGRLPLVAAHTGLWAFDETPGGCRVSVRHVVAARYADAPTVLGGEAGPDDVRPALAGTVTRISGAVLHHLRTR